MKPCLTCGEPSPATYCDEHQPSRSTPRGSARERGYDRAWDKLSKRARRLQPFCEDCGATDRLTTDHKPSAWERHAAGLPLRLADVAVVCAACNAARGSSRPGTPRARGYEGTERRSGPLEKAHSPSHTPGGIR